MITIKKGKAPKELLQYGRQDLSSYAGMPSDVKKKVIESLLSEQGHLCAYCMSRIDGGEGKHRATIEHWLPQAASAEKNAWIIKICWLSAGEIVMPIPIMTKAVTPKEEACRESSRI